MKALYAAFLRIAIAVELQYRASSVIWLIGMVVEPVIYLAVWSAAAAAQGGEVGGYDAADFAAYYLLLTVVNQLTSGWHMWEFQFRVQQGQFAFLLLRPVHPLHNDLAENLAHKAMMQPFLLPMVALLWFAFAPELSLEPWAIAAFVPALALAFLLRFAVEYTLALACFWTTRILAVNQTYFAVLFFLSGRVAPVDLLPDWLQWASAALPFRWMVAFPVEVALGRVAPGDVATGLAIQAAWIALAALGFVALWPRAIRRFSAVGG